MTARYEHDDIARIAYRSWLDRGQPEGSPEVDWYYALSVVTNPEEVRPVLVGQSLEDESISTSTDESRNGFAAHAAQGADGESMQDDAEQTGRRPELSGPEAISEAANSKQQRGEAQQSSPQLSSQSSRAGTKGGRRASDKLSRSQA